MVFRYFRNTFLAPVSIRAPNRQARSRPLYKLQCIYIRKLHYTERNGQVHTQAALTPQK